MARCHTDVATGNTVVTATKEIKDEAFKSDRRCWYRHRYIKSI